MESTKRPSNENKPRPTGVTVVGVIAILGALLGLFGALPVLLGRPTALELALGSLVVVFSILGFAVGGGLLFRAARGVWMFAVVFYILSIPLGIFEIVAGDVTGGMTGMTSLTGGTIRTLVGIVFVYYLMRPGVKSYFGGSSSAMKP